MLATISMQLGGCQTAGTSEIPVAETITETEIIDPTLTDTGTETMVILEMEIE